MLPTPDQKKLVSNSLKNLPVFVPLICLYSEEQNVQSKFDQTRMRDRAHEVRCVKKEAFKYLRVHLRLAPISDLVKVYKPANGVIKIILKLRCNWEL